MSINNSNEKESSSLDLPPEFEDYLNFEAYIPHKLKLIRSDNEKNPCKNNFINSSLYCLTNLKYFLEFFYKLDDLNSASFKVLKQTIEQIYENIKNSKEAEIQGKPRAAEFNPFAFTKFILERIKLFENNSYRNPRVLIDCILNKFILVNNFDMSLSSNLGSSNARSLNTGSTGVGSTSLGSANSNERIISILSQLNLDSISSQSNISFSVKESYGIEHNKYIEDKISIVIKKTRKCSDNNCGETETIYKNITTLHFNLKDTNKEYSLYDCIDEFLKEENEKKGICSKCFKENICNKDSLFYKFPESIIIFIYYGEEKDNDEFKHFYYNFEDILDFSNLNNKFVDDKLKNEKYFLSSLIACKFPKIEKDPNKEDGENFITFCRKDKDSKFVVYNPDSILDNRTVKRQIKKLKTEELDPKKSYPFALIYTSIKDKI